eukprot:5414425-Pyramimonas_sp.AAC.1
MGKKRTSSPCKAKCTKGTAKGRAKAKARSTPAPSTAAVKPPEWLPLTPLSCALRSDTGRTVRLVVCAGSLSHIDALLLRAK